MRMSAVPIPCDHPVFEPLESRTLLNGVGLLITEFMATNTKTLADLDGDYSDWIEIYNPTNNAVNLQNWALTTSATNLQQWKFPAVTLKPASYLIVFASGKDRAVAGAELHTNFKLSGSGEYLGLVEPNGITIDSQYSPAYPAQQPDVSYGLTEVSSNLNLITAGATSSAYIPVDDSLTDVWQSPGFDDSLWQHAGTGVGYDRGSGYQGLIGNDVGSMYGTNSSAYIRIPFTLADVNNFTSLTLNMKFDDGFVAYLNGQAVASSNDPDTLAWNSAATADVEAGTSYTSFDISGDVDLLQEGINVLSIQGLNSSATSDDFLILPTLTGTQVQYQDDATLQRFFQAPSPGQLNLGGTKDLGPLVTSTTANPPQPKDADNLTIKATVKKSVNNVSSVQLHYRVQFGTEVVLTMYDDGAHGDGAANDSVYAATIPASASTPDQLVRWYVTATDTAANSTRDPLYINPTGSTQYYGTVVQNTSYTTQMPIFLYFVQSTSAADTTSGTRGSVYFQGELYDNVFMRLRGSTINSGSGAVKSRKINFNPDHHFLYDPTKSRVSNINVNLTGPQDDSYIRNELCYSLYNAAGAAGPDSDMWHVRQNGTEVGVRVFFNDGNADMLQEEGLDPNGSFYKVSGSRLDTPGSTGGLEKKTRLDEGYSDVLSLINGINVNNANRHNYVMDNLDLSALVNYLAVDAIISDSDIIQTNYDLYRDTDGTGEWRIIPYDRDLTWGSYVSNADRYSMSIYYGASNHSNSARGWNMLLDAVYDDPIAREMFRRRLRTLCDEFVKPIGSTPDQFVLEKWIDGWSSKMSYEATHNQMLGYSPAKNFATGTAYLKDWYLFNRRNFLYNGVYDGQHIPDAQPTAARGQIQIGAMDYSPVSGDQNQEYIRLDNPNDYAVDISGWQLTGGISYTFEPGTVIVGGSSLYVAKDVKSFRARTTGPSGNQGLYVVGGYSGNISADGETMRLITPANGEIASVAVPQDHVVVNEVLANSKSGGIGDWVELYNPTGAAVDMSGWWLSDDNLTPQKYQIPAGTVVQPGGYAVFNERDNFGVAFGFSKDGEGVYLSGPTGVLVDGKAFDASPSDVTFGRYMTSEGKWEFPLLASGTPGAANSYPLVGPVVLSEIMYHPLDGGEEYIELKNTSNDSVALFDSMNPSHTWKISGGVSFTFPTGQSIPADGYAVVTDANVTDPTILAAFRAKYSIPSDVIVYGPFLGHLSNGSDTVNVSYPGKYDAVAGTYSFIKMDHVDYTDTFPWAEAADGTGDSLERVAAAKYANDPQNWAAYRDGSPGRPSLLPGDDNLDGKVSFVDYLVLEQNFGKSGMAWATGDFNGDGVVSFVDYLALEVQFGKSLPAGSLPALMAPSDPLAADLAVGAPLASTAEGTSGTDLLATAATPANLAMASVRSPAPGSKAQLGQLLRTLRNDAVYGKALSKGAARSRLLEDVQVDLLTPVWIKAGQQA